MKTRRRGLTLIELMVTTVLAGLIMSSLMHVVTMTGRMQDTMTQTPVYEQAWRNRLTQQLSGDLTRAHTVIWADDALLLEGWNGWDRQTGEAIHEPSRIAYRLVTIGPEKLALVREQRDLLDLGQQRPGSMLMGIDVESMTLNARNISHDVVNPSEVYGAPEDSLASRASNWELIIAFNVHEPVVLPVPKLALEPERLMP